MIALSAAHRSAGVALNVTAAHAAGARVLAEALHSWQSSRRLWGVLRQLCTVQPHWSTIAALSSGVGRAGIAVIRISGPNAGAHALYLLD